MIELVDLIKFDDECYLIKFDSSSCIIIYNWYKCMINLLKFINWNNSSALFARNEAGNPSRETLQGPPGKTHSFSNSFLRKKVLFGLQTTFFDVFNVLLSFLAEKWYRTIMKSHQKANFGTKECSYGEQTMVKFWRGLYKEYSKNICRNI